MIRLQITLFALCWTGAYDGCTANVVSAPGLGDCLQQALRPLFLLLELQVLANADKMISINLGDSVSAMRSNKLDGLFFW